MTSWTGLLIQAALRRETRRLIAEMDLREFKDGQRATRFLTCPRDGTLHIKIPCNFEVKMK